MSRAVVLLALPFLLPLPFAAGEATDPEASWSWRSADITGEMAVRLTLDFSIPTECLITFQTFGKVLGVQEELFMGRDDGDIDFLIASMSGETAYGAAWNLDGETDIHHVGLFGPHRGIRVTNLAQHEGTESWLFVGIGLGLVPEAPTDAAFALDLSCEDPPANLSVEAGREVAPFGPGAVCTDREILGYGIWGCAALASAASGGEWTLASGRGVIRFHQFSWTADAGHVRLDADGQSGEMLYHSSGFHDAPPGIRLEGGPGHYGYTITHVGVVPAVASGWVVGLEPVASPDEWPDLPRLEGS